MSSSAHLSPNTSDVASGRTSADGTTHRRRGSSLGRMDVGDTSPSLSTMNKSKAQRQKSSDRVAQLSKHSSTDSQILKKFWVAYRELSYRQTWINPFLVLVITVVIFLVSNPQGKVHEFLEACMIPSYKIEGTDQYGKGGNDFYFVFYYAIFFTFFREFCMCLLFKPLTAYFNITKEAKVKRFMEQAYAITYFGSAGVFGLWIMSRTPLWFFETTPMYLDYPHKTHDFWFKLFYLGQAAYWTQQSIILIFQVEKPRSDHYQFVFHHIVTIALIWNSYRFHFTWIGLEIFITMDVSDFFLGFSKLLNYLDAPITGPFFVIFVFVWTYLRHYINLKILWSVLTEFRTVGEWELNWVTQQYKCWISQPIVFFLIGALQLVNLYWLYLIFRILARYASAGETVDERSDDEDEDEEEEESATKKTQ